MTPPPACFRGEQVRQVRELRNGDTQTGGVTRIDQWIARMLETDCPVPLLCVIGPELSAEVEQVELGRFEVAMTLDGLHRPNDEDTDHVLETLRGMPRDNIASMRLTLKDVGDEIRADIEAALVGLEVELVG